MPETQLPSTQRFVSSADVHISMFSHSFSSNIHLFFNHLGQCCALVQKPLVCFAGFLTSLLSDSSVLDQLSTSLNSALELAQQSGLNLQALANALDSAQDSAVQAQLRSQAALAQVHLRLPPGSNAVVTNGRVIVVQSEALGLDDAFTAEDFGLLVGWHCNL